MVGQVLNFLLDNYRDDLFGIEQYRHWAQSVRNTLAIQDSTLLAEYMAVDTDSLSEEDLKRWTLDVYVLLRVEQDEEGYILLTEVAGGLFNMQMQYLHHHIKGLRDSEKIKVDDLRYKSNWSYHASRLHINDMPVFIRRTRSLARFQYAH